MNQERLYTLKDIAKELNLAESTARYFRDKYPEYIPTVQLDRRTYYQPEAVEVLRVIAEETQSRLNALFAINMEAVEESQRNNAAAQQQRSNNELITLEEWKKAQQ